MSSQIDPGTDGYVSVPEGRIHYVRQGNGDPVVLLHPTEISLWAWHAVLEPLGRQFLCYALDILGHAESDQPKENFSIPDHARAVHNFMEAVGIQRAHVIGNSLGAILAVELAARYPDSVNRLVLMGCPAWDPRGAPQRLPQVAPDPSAVASPRTLDSVKALGLFANPKPEWVDRINELRVKSASALGGIFEAAAWYDLPSRLPSIRASSTLLLYGEHDRQLEFIDLLKHNVANSRKVVMPGLGHIFQIEDPEAFISVVLPFLT